MLPTRDLAAQVFKVSPLKRMNRPSVNSCNGIFIGQSIHAWVQSEAQRRMTGHGWHTYVECLLAVQVFAELCPVLGLRVGLAAAQASVGTEAATHFRDATPNRQFVHGKTSSHRCIPVISARVSQLGFKHLLNGDH